MGRIILTSSPMCIFTALEIRYSWCRAGLIGSICYSILSLTWPDKISEVFLFVWCKIWCYIKLSCPVSDTERLKYWTKAVKLDEWMLFTTKSATKMYRCKHPITLLSGGLFLSAFLANRLHYFQSLQGNISLLCLLSAFCSSFLLFYWILLGILSY